MVGAGWVHLGAHRILAKINMSGEPQENIKQSLREVDPPAAARGRTLEATTLFSVGNEHSQPLHDEHAEESEEGRLLEYLSIVKFRGLLFLRKVIFAASVRYIVLVAFHGSCCFLNKVR